MFDSKILKNKKVLVVGLGGVGGYFLEAIARSGVGNIDIIDFDKVDITNINRQIIALDSTVDKYKTDVFYDRLKDINKDIVVNKFNICLTEEINLDKDYDYIADCIDMLKPKMALIKFAKENNINIISAASAGGKKDITKLKIDKLKKTYNCPICKILRSNLKNIDLDICFSIEDTIKNDEFIPSNAIIPPAMGLMMAEFVLTNLVKK